MEKWYHREGKKAIEIPRRLVNLYHAAYERFIIFQRKHSGQKNENP